MKRILMSALAAASLAAAVTPALAEPVGGRINEREARIAERIDQGARNGDFSFREVRGLRNELRSIEAVEQRYRGYDHRMDDRARADLQLRLDALSARVFVDRHNHEDRRDHEHRRF